MGEDGGPVTEARAANRVPLVVVGLVVLLFLVLLALVYSSYSQQARFEKDGIETTAVFVSGRTQQTRSQPDKAPRYNHYATVRFEVGERLVIAEARVTGDFLRAHEPGARVPIRYLRDDPETVLVDPLFASRSMALAWMFLIFFAGVLIWPLVKRWRQRRPKAPAPAQRERPKAGPLPRWVRVTSGVLMLCALGSFFTLSIWLRYAVEAWALPRLGWASLPLGMASMLVPPVAFGLVNLALIRGGQGRRKGL